MCCSLYKPVKNLGKSCTHRVHRCQNVCTRQPKCAHRVQGAPLISNTVASMHQCPKLSLYFVHSQGVFALKLCTRKLLHAPFQYIAIINSSKNVHTPGPQLQTSCTRLWKCVCRVQGAPLISDTVHISLCHPFLWAAWAKKMPVWRSGFFFLS